MSELEIERDTHKTRQQKERERSKRMQEKECKRDTVGVSLGESGCMREGALDRERDSACVTLCVSETATGEMGLRAAFLDKPDILYKEASYLSKGAYILID